MVQMSSKADRKVLVAIYEKQNNPLGIESGKKRKADDGVEGIGGWAYMGSHNFTPSAWVSFRVHLQVPADE